MLRVSPSRALSAALSAALVLAGSLLFAQPAASDAAAGAAWLLAGPFPVGAIGALEDGLDRDFLAASGMAAAEAQAAPLRIGAPGASSWREAAGGADGQSLDFIASFGNVTNAVAYAYREIYAASPRRVSLKVGSDDGVKVWINGGLVLADHGYRALQPDQDAVRVSLARGKNRMLVKVSQGTGEWAFTMRIVTLDEESAAAAKAKPVGIAAFSDELAVPQGSAVRGTVMTLPAFCVDGAVKVVLLGSAGEVLASSQAEIGGAFELRPPPGFTGPARLTAEGLGALAYLAPQPSLLVVGDAHALGAAAVAKARREAAAGPIGGEAVDTAATLEYLAAVLDGSQSSSVGKFDLSVLALSEIEALVARRDPGASGAARTSFPRGLVRVAYRSSVDGSIQPYSLYVPEAYDSSKRYGLVMALHGAGGNDYEMAASLAAARPKDMLLVSAFGRGDLGYVSTGERDVLDVLDLVQARFSIDPDRVYLTGRSMGGFGTWRLGAAYSYRFAAIAPFAGWTDLDCLENLVSTPVLAVHGSADMTVPIASDMRAIPLLKSFGCEARLDILPGVGHDALGAWIAKDGPGRLFAWFRQWRRQAWPPATRIRTTMAKYGKGAWASIVGLAKPLSFAALDAKIADARHVTVDTQNVSAFELDLRHPSLAKSGRILIIADGVNLTADSQSGAARFELGSDGRFAAVGAGPRPQANGGSGVSGLFDGPLRIVYGTRGRGQAETDLAVARVFANVGLGRFEVMPDSALTPEAEASASILLVGWPEDNSVLARLAARLPVALKAGKASVSGENANGSGAILVMPNPEAPGRLLGVVSLPPRGGSPADYAGLIASSLRDCIIAPTAAGAGTPDVAVLDRAGAAVWGGCFDWKWKTLTRLETAAK